jgi:hypothetical protein
MRGVVGDAEFLLQDGGDPPGRPQIVRKPVRPRARTEESRHPLTLPRGQLPRAPRRGFRRQACGTLATQRLTPLSHGADRRPHRPGHHRQRQAAVQQAHRAPPTPLQLGRAPLWSHGQAVPQVGRLFYYLYNDQ